LLFEVPAAPDVLDEVETLPEDVRDPDVLVVSEVLSFPDESLELLEVESLELASVVATGVP
jgi:hypothetical protein